VFDFAKDLFHFQINDDTAAATTPNPASGGQGDEAWFDKLTMTDYQF